MIKKYELKNGETRYMLSKYLGIDPETGKEVRPTRRGLKTRREAKNVEARLIAEFEEKGKIKVQKKVYFNEVFNLWLNNYEQTVRESSFSTTSLTTKKHILPYFSDFYIDQITISHCQKFTRQLSEKIKSYKTLVSLLSRIFDFAISLGFVNKNPMTGMVIPKIKVNDSDADELQESDQFLETDELNLFFEFANRYKKIDFIIRYRLLAYTGIRRGELVGLQWKDLDEVNKTLSIRRSVNKNKKGKWVLGPTKTVRSNRTLTIDDETFALLIEWRTEQKNKMQRLGHNTNSPQQHILADKNNTWLTPMAINNQLERFLTRYELKMITPHGFRHTHCTLLFSAGYTLNEVQHRMGHKDAATTLRVYNHLTEKDKTRSANAFNDFINGVKTGVTDENPELKLIEPIGIKGFKL